MTTKPAGMFTYFQILLLLTPAASFSIHDGARSSIERHTRTPQPIFPTTRTRTSSHAYISTTRTCSVFHTRYNKMKRPNFLSSSVTGDETSSNEQSLPEPSTMRIREIKDELNAMGVSFTDCFDKDSLSERLLDARSGKVTGKKKAQSAAASSTESSQEAAKESATTAKASSSNFDKEAAMAELRSKRVRELRTMCAQNNIRWAHFIEKDELVRALVQHQEKAADFSPSGKIMPGKVAVIDDDILSNEIAPGAAVTPLLLGK